MSRQCTNFLMHYGVKGMKWGVRRYQNTDGTLTKLGKQHYSMMRPNGDMVVKKGTRLSRLTDNPESKPYTINNFGDIDHTSTYVSMTKSDNRWYDRHMPASIVERNQNFQRYGIPPSLYKISYKASQDLLLPSEKKQVETFLETLSDDPATSEYLSKVYKNTQGENPLHKSSIRKNYEMSNKEIMKKYGDMKIKDAQLTDEQIKQVNLFLNHDELARTTYHDFDKKYDANLIKKGYNAVLDSNDIKIDYGRTKNPDLPMRILDAGKNLERTGTRKYTWTGNKKGHIKYYT